MGTDLPHKFVSLTSVFALLFDEVIVQSSSLYCPVPTPGTVECVAVIFVSLHFFSPGNCHENRNFDFSSWMKSLISAVPLYLLFPLLFLILSPYHLKYVNVSM